MTELSNIRNFSIIAHIDHGKSTLADRLLEQCHAIDQRIRAEQMLDSMDLERERGITIKSSAVTLHYTAADGEKYVLNLIDTPGHVDFNYEVSRSLAACEGAILVVDASQGVEAQTLANTYLAIDAGLEVLPVINKIDLPSARPAEVKSEIEDIIGIPAEDAPEISAKNGINIPAVLEMIVRDVPAPTGERDAPLQALIFDQPVRFLPGRHRLHPHQAGNGEARHGHQNDGHRRGLQGGGGGYHDPRRAEPLGRPGRRGSGLHHRFHQNRCGHPGGRHRHRRGESRRPAPARLPSRPAHGVLRHLPRRRRQISGFTGRAGKTEAQRRLHELRAGKLHRPRLRLPLRLLLHMEIIQERLEREYNLDLITTAPNVVYRITKTNGESMYVYTPLDYPDPADIQLAEEPYAKVSLISPQEYVGNIMELCQNRRGEFKDMVYLDASRVELHYEMPLNEIIYDFFDALKSRTRGYGSLDYELIGYRPSRLVKLDILLNGDVVDALSFILFADNAYPRARKICEKLKENIPRAQFEIPVQAAIGGKVIARETIKALRKDVLAKCYGGDITRKKKLLEKQKEGKKRMRTFGTVAVPSEAFMAVLKLDED